VAVYGTFKQPNERQEKSTLELLRLMPGRKIPTSVRTTHHKETNTYNQLMDLGDALHSLHRAASCSGRLNRWR
jgi:hypothetical protein